MPGSCSRVALNALEEIGLAYRDRGIALMRGEQRGEAFVSLNPKGKLPVLVTDGVVTTELPAILYHLANIHPRASLLPMGTDGRPDLAALSDVIWLASALHPLANRIFRPAAVSQIDQAGVKAAAIDLLAAQASGIATRLSNRMWWYGDAWSSVDTFIAWIFWVAHASGFPAPEFPVLLEHRARVEARPAFTRTLARERAAVARDNLPLPPGFSI